MRGAWLTAPAVGEGRSSVVTSAGCRRRITRTRLGAMAETRVIRAKGCSPFRSGQGELVYGDLAHRYIARAACGADDGYRVRGCRRALLHGSLGCRRHFARAECRRKPNDLRRSARRQPRANRRRLRTPRAKCTDEQNHRTQAPPARPEGILDSFARITRVSAVAPNLVRVIRCLNLTEICLILATPPSAFTS